MSRGDAADGPGPVLAVVHEAGHGAPGSALVLGLRGLRHDADAEMFAARIAERHRRFRVTLEGHGPGRHTLRLFPDAGAPGAASPGPAPPGSASPSGELLSGELLSGELLGGELLADLLGPYPGAGEPLALAGDRRELLVEAVTRADGPDRYLEQVHWNWSGPLERARFDAAWQSVCGRESILRAAFDWTAVPRLLLHPYAEVEIVHHARADTTWRELLDADRARGFALNRPPLLRLALLEGAPGAPTRVLLTCHRALLDERGVHLLLRAFYRAYLAAGALPGGERRPDLRDHARWLARQSARGARQLWARAAPPRGAATAPGRPGPDTGQSGEGRLRRRLEEPYGRRLRSWAAQRGVGESGALYTVWALLLYRAAAAGGCLPVSFGVRVCGGDIALPGAGGIPGLLGSALPMTVRVDPAAPLAGLLRQVHDARLDMGAYPWVSGDLIRAWSGRGPGERLTDTVLVFDGPADPGADVERELEAQGIGVDAPQAVGAGGGVPVTVVARHESGGALVLDAVYDRARLADADAAALLGQCVGLLRALTELPDPDPTVGGVLGLLADTKAPSVAARPPAVRRGALRTLRAGAASAEVICLLAVPGVVEGCYELFARDHRGPQTIVVLDLDGPPGAVVPAALAGLPARGRRLVLGGCGPGAGAAYALARVLADGPGSPVSVVMTGLGGPRSSAQALARGLAGVAVRRD
ncbi:condensation domain-containing protein [Streptomyces sp. NPDC060020]|uniref:condensation domain-containing protein n=1 Tax=Streptomyces sp. NPDC060020 TaxID=3347038 RepID=UPI0036BB5555